MVIKKSEDCRIWWKKYKDQLQDSIKLALSSSFRNNIKNMNNIYGIGAAADIILDKLINEPISVIKKFRDQL